MHQAAYPPAHSCRETSIAAEAEWLAGLPAAEAEAFCDRQIAEAIRQWRVSDATEWQRVKFRARFMRALGSRGSDAGARS